MKTTKIVPVGSWILCDKESNDYKASNGSMVLTKAADNYRINKGKIVEMGTKVPKDLVDNGDTIYAPDTAVITADLLGKKYFFIQPQNILGKEVVVEDND